MGSVSSVSRLLTAALAAVLPFVVGSGWLMYNAIGMAHGAEEVAAMFQDYLFITLEACFLCAVFYMCYCIFRRALPLIRTK